MSESREPYGNAAETVEQEATGLISSGRVKLLQQAGLSLVRTEDRQRAERAEAALAQAQAALSHLLDAYWLCGRMWSRDAFEQNPVVRAARAALAGKEGENG